MQIHQASLEDGQRPCPGKACPQCGGCIRLHKHGRYTRWRGVDGAQAVEVVRYICPRCRHTWSVIPEGMMPYRSLPVERFEQLTDKHFGLAGEDPRPPPATEKEDGCIRRAIKKLSIRIPFLCGLLGQQLPVFVNTDTCRFWQALRELGPTMNIMVQLACDFKTSLFGCYRSLRAFWQREPPVLAQA
jgi:ssDNA-binding Zn-finger/Zn-ribbon topoisomerase 1